VTARESCVTWEPSRPPTPIRMGGPVPSGRVVRIPGGPEQYSALRAIDPTTGQVRWEHRFTSVPPTVTLDLSGGAMSTASGLVFSGDHEGYVNAFESTGGKLLWRFQTGAPVWGVAPISYSVDGRQWVVVPSGVTLNAFALPAQGSR
jgi:glucose dehydrogenase